MQRVLVIGCGGAGKSTFAAQLAQRTGLPLVHLDREYWRAGWVEPPKDEWHARVDALVAGERWILDGNYGGTMERRLAACDTVVFLDASRWSCLWRVLARWLRHRGEARPDMAPGSHERMELSFLAWIFNYPERSRPKVLKRLAALQPGQRAVVLRSRREVEEFLVACAPRTASQPS
jgi:adenylate kinase family enzyme